MLIIFGDKTYGQLAINVCEEAGKTFYYFAENDSEKVEMHNGVRLTATLSSEEIIAFIKENDIRCAIYANLHPAEDLLHTFNSLGLQVIRMEKNIGKYVLRRAIEKSVPDFFPLKTGLTTGACATAATKAALLSLLFDEQPEEISFALPDGEVLSVPVKIEAKGIASVVKDFSDDPDVTKGCKIISMVQHADRQGQGIRFLQGEGVGVVTLPGLGIPVGGPAVNSTPREMIRREIRAISSEDFDVTISVENGEELAKKTFNPKVGVIGGISIIGTSGIVAPLSNEAFIQSIGRELEVAKAIGCKEIGIVSGKNGETALREDHPGVRVIHYGNFVGETLKKAHALGFEKVIIGIMIGKAVKLAEGNLDTHSHKVQMNKSFLKGLAGHNAYLIDTITMARELWQIMPQEFFDRITTLCYKHCRGVFPNGELTIKLIKSEK